MGRFLEAGVSAAAGVIYSAGASERLEPAGSRSERQRIKGRKYEADEFTPQHVPSSRAANVRDGNDELQSASSLPPMSSSVGGV